MKCSVESCEAEVKYCGLCGMHYKRRWRHGDVNKVIIKERSVLCKTDGCELRAVEGPYCKYCDKKFKKYGRTKNIINPKGVGGLDTNGYYLITVDGKRQYEHIVIAEKALGRPLPEGAVVHHTGPKWDNEGFFKLVICPDQAYHLLLHRRAKELGYEYNSDC